MYNWFENYIYMRLPSLNMWPFRFVIAVTESIWFMFSFEMILSSTAHFLPILCLVGYLKAVLSLHHRNQISIVDDSFPTKLVLICIILHYTEIIKIQSPQYHLYFILIIYFLGFTFLSNLYNLQSLILFSFYNPWIIWSYP